MAGPDVTGPRTHRLKTWPEYYQALFEGAKTFEARRDDRGFQEGDFLHLVEWDPVKEMATGRYMLKRVGFVLRGGSFGVREGFAVLSLLPPNSSSANPPA